MRAATVVQQLCESCRTCFKFYCMFYYTCDRSFIHVSWSWARCEINRRRCVMDARPHLFHSHTPRPPLSGRFLHRYQITPLRDRRTRRCKQVAQGRHAAVPPDRESMAAWHPILRIALAGALYVTLRDANCLLCVSKLGRVAKPGVMASRRVGRNSGPIFSPFINQSSPNLVHACAGMITVCNTILRLTILLHTKIFAIISRNRTHVDVPGPPVFFAEDPQIFDRNLGGDRTRGKIRWRSTERPRR